ncbi:epiplakin-like [Emydura macquarii macquarii]|uniref:epiplakin-like n=1 Tax=Emydura macquarii macquarii TaxID=1129001 RepID=UPI00352B580B
MASKQAGNAYEDMDLEGSNVIAGVLIQSSNKKMSIYQAMMRGILTQGTALVLLEAQAAVGFIVDPVKNKKVPVRDALAAGLTGGHFYGKLLSAERAVTGYKDPYTGNKISLFQAMKKDLIVKDHGIRLLEAQIATGGIIDPVHSHRVPVEVAYKRGYFNQEMNRILSDPEKHSRSCFDPNTHENLTYMQLLSRCVPDPDTGLYMLHLMHKGSVLFQLDEQMRISLQSAPATVSVGLFQGQNVTVWELLFSRYVPDHRRQELLKKYKAGTLTIQEMITIITTIITETEEKRSRETRPVKSPSRQRAMSQKAEASHSQRDEKWEKALKSTTVDVPVGEFQGQNVSVWDLLFSKYVLEEKRQELLKSYEAGTLTVHEMITILTAVVTEAEGRSSKCPTTKKTPSKETTTLEEVNDAPSHEGQQLEKALKSTLVEVPVGEFHGRKVSVWDLLFSKYIPEEKRKELLELYRAGILSTDQMKTIVTTIVTKTEEERHHLLRHGESPGTEMTTSGEAEPPHSPHDKHLENALRIETVNVPVGEFKGQEVSLWELLFSSYIAKTKRQELLKKYRAGSLTIQEMVIIITTIITETEMGSRNLCTNTEAPRKAVVTSDKAVDVYSHEQHLKKSLKCVTIYVTAGEFQGQKVSLLDLLFSQYIPQEKRQTLLELYRTGILTTDQMITAITSIITKTEEASRKFMKSAKSPKRDEITSKEAVLAHSPQDTQVENILKSTTIDVPLGMFQGSKVSVWDLLFSKYIPEEKRQEILELYKEGILALDQVITVVTTIVKKKEATSRKFVINVKTPSKDIKTSEQAENIHSHEDHQLEKTLKSTMVDVPAGEFHEQKTSVWDLLFSNYIPEEKRQEILELYKEGMLTLDQVITIVTTIVKKKYKEGMLTLDLQVGNL